MFYLGEAIDAWLDKRLKTQNHIALYFACFCIGFLLVVAISIALVVK